MEKRGIASWNYIRNHLTVTICLKLCLHQSNNWSISYSVTWLLFLSSSVCRLNHLRSVNVVNKKFDTVSFYGLLVDKLLTHLQLVHYRKAKNRNMKPETKIETLLSLGSAYCTFKKKPHYTTQVHKHTHTCFYIQLNSSSHLHTHSFLYVHPVTHRQMLIQDSKKGK